MIHTRNIVVLPAEVEVAFNEGQNLFQILNRAGFPLAHDCAGKGICGKCKFRLHSGLPRPSAVDLEFLTKQEIDDQIHLACAFKPDDGDIVELFSGDLKATPQDEVIGLTFPVDRWPGVETSELALAIDLGTTNVVGYLLDANNGAIINAISIPNSQSMYGSDVMSRLAYASHKGREAVLNLQRLALNDIERLAMALNTNKIPIRRVVGVMNSAMATFVIASNPDDLGRHPCESGIDGPVSQKPFNNKKGVLEKAELIIPPVIGGYVGSDALSALYAVLESNPPAPFALLDIGTNTEVLLVTDNAKAACSAPAGPSFEGYGISHGMRAVDGAIERVTISGGAFSCQVIGKSAPKGIAGSGLFSLFAELIRAGGLDKFGSIVPENLSPEMYRSGEKSLELVIAPGVTVDGVDIQQFMVAKAATRAGLETLLDHLGVKPEQLRKIYFAGAFVQRVEPQDLLAIGLTPDVESSRICNVGNAACAGSAMMAVSREAFVTACSMAGKIEHLPLSGNAYFNMSFQDHVRF
ncbi:hypothetical protein MNBD_NITROSPINAE04-2718 [hydrothermal vent metagenome]|uniref:2Fe-2S ferredoxin-type domain-containing protein n=1 Tax=hydrothermal vent metagenome TaxID=652676 RepID=A0A3B1CTK0_9ZZZZ